MMNFVNYDNQLPVNLDLVVSYYIKDNDIKFITENCSPFWRFKTEIEAMEALIHVDNFIFMRSKK